MSRVDRLVPIYMDADAGCITAAKTIQITAVHCIPYQRDTTLTSQETKSHFSAAPTAQPAPTRVQHHIHLSPGTGSWHLGNHCHTHPLITTLAGKNFLPKLQGRYKEEKTYRSLTLRCRSAPSHLPPC